MCETLATFLDNQHNPKYINDLTYIDDDGDRCAIAFQIPNQKKILKQEENLITSGLNGQTVILEELLIIRMPQ